MPCAFCNRVRSIIAWPQNYRKGIRPQPIKKVVSTPKPDPKGPARWTDKLSK
jgi:hypothetical protein